MSRSVYFFSDQAITTCGLLLVGDHNVFINTKTRWLVYESHNLYIFLNICSPISYDDSYLIVQNDTSVQKCMCVLDKFKLRAWTAVISIMRINIFDIETTNIEFLENNITV